MLWKSIFVCLLFLNISNVLLFLIFSSIVQRFSSDLFCYFMHIFLCFFIFLLCMCSFKGSPKKINTGGKRVIAVCDGGAGSSRSGSITKLVSKLKVFFKLSYLEALSLSLLASLFISRKCLFLSPHSLVSTSLAVPDRGERGHYSFKNQFESI